MSPFSGAATAKPGAPELRAQYLALVQKLVAEVLHKPGYELTEDFVLGDASDWDSLTHLEVLMNLEEELGVTFEMDDFSEIKTIGALIDLIVAAKNA